MYVLIKDSSTLLSEDTFTLLLSAGTVKFRSFLTDLFVLFWVLQLEKFPSSI